MEGIKTLIKGMIDSLPDLKGIEINPYYDNKSGAYVVIVSPGSKLATNTTIIEWETEFLDNYFDGDYKEELIIVGDNNIGDYELIVI